MLLTLWDTFCVQDNTNADTNFITFKLSIEGSYLNSLILTLNTHGNAQHYTWTLNIQHLMLGHSMLDQLQSTENTVGKREGNADEPWSSYECPSHAQKYND